MAKIKSGILGGYSGTIGSVTGYRRNGKNIIQATRNTPKGPLNEAGILQASKMEIASLRYARYEKIIWRMLSLMPHKNWIKWNDFLYTGLNDSLLQSRVQWQGLRLPSDNNIFSELEFFYTDPISTNASITVTGISKYKILYPDLQWANILSRSPSDAWFANWSTVTSNIRNQQHVLVGTSQNGGTLAGICLRSLSAGIYSPIFCTIKSSTAP